MRLCNALWRAGLTALVCVASLAQAAPPALVLKPLVGGSLSVVAITPRYTSLDLDALTERVDVSLEHVAMWNRSHAGYVPATESGVDEGWSREAVEARLGKLFGRKPPAAILLGNLDPALLPAATQSAIVQYVEQGGGLALSYVDEPAEGPLRTLLDGLSPIEVDPEFGRGLIEAFAPDGTPLAHSATAYAYGAGRVVWFRYPGDVPLYHALYPPAAAGIETDQHHVEHACALWARVLSWLAKREPGVKVATVNNVAPQGPSDAEVPPDLPEEFIASMRDSVVAQSMRAFACTLEGYAERGDSLEWRLRPVLESGPGYLTRSGLANGSDAGSTQLFTGPGVFFVDALLKRKDAVVDWRSETVTIPDWPEIESIRSDKTFLLANDRLNIELEMRSVYSVHRSATVYAQAVDSQGRLVAQAWQPITHAGGRVVLTLTFADLIAPLIEVRLLAIEGAPRALSQWDFYAGASDRLRFPVQFARQSNELAWCVPAETLLESNAEEYAARLQGIGVSHVSAAGGRPALVAAARHGMLLTPLAADYGVERAGEGFVREPSLAGRGYAFEEDERLREEVLDYYAGGAGMYLLGNPALVVDSEDNACQSDASMAAFRNLAATHDLNLPSDDAALREAVSPAPGSDADPGPFYTEFRLFMESQLAGFLGARRKTLQQAHPGALVGIGALSDENPYRGYDWHALATQLDFVALAWDEAALYRVLAYGASPTMSGLQLPRDWSAAQCEQAVWFSAMAGLGSVWSMQPFGHALDGGVGALLDEHGNATENATRLAAAIKAVNEGLAPLLRSATPVEEAVSILDTPRSRHGIPEVAARYRASVTEMTRLLRGAGHWPHFTHASALAKAHRSGIRMLLAPSDAQFDDAELEALKGYVKDGGLVAACPPGCAALEGIVDAASLRCLPVDAGARVAGLIDLLEAEGLKPALPLDMEGLRKLGGNRLAMRAFRYGGADLYVSSPWMEGEGKPEGASLHFEKKDFVYLPLSDERTARGHKARMDEDTVTCAVRLDYEVRELQVECPESVMAGDRVNVRCKVAAETVNPGRHLVLLALSMPLGDPIAGGRRWLTCERGAGQGYVPVPLNAIPGVYQLRARDLLTGYETRKNVEVITPSGPGFQGIH